MSKLNSFLRGCNAIVVETPQGALIGTKTGIYNDVCVFKGIPYAVPPVGDRRWRVAESAPSWGGLRVATTFGPESVQSLLPENSFYYHPAFLSSEDCLYLNVWAPAQIDDLREKVPVMVWIHGGALTEGSGSSLIFDGSELARKGVIVVTINYRLGIFGYFSHPELSSESPHGSSGNYGTTDQIQALKWVQENIEAFGGDPNRVTIFGESAGSWSVSHLMASPLTKNLFHRAIGQSGAYWYPMRYLKTAHCGRPSAEEKGVNFAETIGRNTLSELRQLCASELHDHAVKTGFLAPEDLAIVDGWVFPQSVYDTFSKGQQHDVPVIVGFNSDEGSALADYNIVDPVPSCPQEYVKYVRESFGTFADDYLSQYPSTNLQNAVFNVFRDRVGTWAMESWAKMMGGVSSNAWLYYFSHTPPGADCHRVIPPGNVKRRVGAFHAAEIGYVFNNIKAYEEGLRKQMMPNWPVAPARPTDLTLAETISDYWVAFAKTGVPKVKGLPEWKPYKEKTKYFMEFNEEAQLKSDLLPGAWKIHQKIYELGQGTASS